MLLTPTILGPVFPTLALQFAGRDTLDSRVTFARSGVATYFDSAGVLQTAANRVARIKAHTHDGVNWINRGFLIEEERTNLALQSETVAAPWTTIGSLNIVVNNSVAPDGTTTMDRLNDVTFGGFDGMAQNITIPTTNLPYTSSVFVQKFVQSTFPEFQIDMTGGTRVRAAVQLNTQTGATFIRIDTGGGGAAVSVEELENHWRISLTLTNVGSNTNLQIVIFPGVTTTFGSIETSALGGINVWGHQLEQGSFATSYIKTTTAAVTRAADVATMSDVSWFNATEGTFFVEANDNGTAPVAPSARLTELNDGADSDRLLMDISNGKPRIFVDDGGITQAALKATDAIVRGTTFKAAGVYKLNDIAVTSEGTAVNTDTMAIMPDPTNFNFTIGTNRAASGNFWNGHIARITYWNRRLPNGVLQSLTA